MNLSDIKARERQGSLEKIPAAPLTRCIQETDGGPRSVGGTSESHLNIT